MFLFIYHIFNVVYMYLYEYFKHLIKDQTGILLTSLWNSLELRVAKYIEIFYFLSVYSLHDIDSRVRSIKHEGGRVLTESKFQNNVAQANFTLRVFYWNIGKGFYIDNSKPVVCQEAGFLGYVQTTRRL